MIKEQSSCGTNILSTKSNTDPVMVNRTPSLTDPRAWYDPTESMKLMKSFVQQYENQTLEPSSIPSAEDMTAESTGENSSDVNRLPSIHDRPSGAGGVRPKSDEIQPQERPKTVKFNVPEDHNEEATSASTSKQSGLPKIQNGQVISEELNHKLNHPLSAAVTLPIIVAHEKSKSENDPSEKAGGMNNGLEIQNTFNDLRLPQHESETKAREVYRDTYILRQKSNIKFKSDISITRENKVKSQIKPHERNSMTQKNDRLWYKSRRTDYISKGNAPILDGTFKPVTSTDQAPSSESLPCQVVYDKNKKHLQERFSSDKENGHVPEHMMTHLENNKGSNVIYAKSTKPCLQHKEVKAAVINLSSTLLKSQKGVQKCPPSSNETEPAVSAENSTPVQNVSPECAQLHSPCDSNSPSLPDTDSGSANGPHPKRRRKVYLRKFKRLEVFGETRRPQTSHRGKLGEEDHQRAHSVPVMRPQNYKLDQRTAVDVWSSSLHTTQESINPIKPIDKSPPNKPAQLTKSITSCIILNPPISESANRTGTWHKGLASRKPIRLEVTVKQRPQLAGSESGFSVSKNSVSGQDNIGFYASFGIDRSELKPGTKLHESSLHKCDVPDENLSQPNTDKLDVADFAPPNTVDDTSNHHDSLLDSGITEAIDFPVTTSESSTNDFDIKDKSLISMNVSDGPEVTKFSENRIAEDNTRQGKDI